MRLLWLLLMLCSMELVISNRKDRNGHKRGELTPYLGRTIMLMREELKTIKTELADLKKEKIENSAVGSIKSDMKDMKDLLTKLSNSKTFLITLITSTFFLHRLAEKIIHLR